MGDFMQGNFHWQTFKGALPFAAIDVKKGNSQHFVLRNLQVRRQKLRLLSSKQS